jgi:hypothetical protein
MFVMCSSGCLYSFSRCGGQKLGVWETPVNTLVKQLAFCTYSFLCWLTAVSAASAATAAAATAWR